MLRFDQIQMDTIYTSEASKNFLVQLKKNTGIQTWNVLCRLAFCHSLKDQSLPRNIDEALNGVEMNYDTFAGTHKGLYLGLLIQNLVKNNVEISKTNLTKYLRAHIGRGIYILFNKKLRKLVDFIK
jgi:DNA sulfur modification protein DndE